MTQENERNKKNYKLPKIIPERDLNILPEGLIRSNKIKQEQIIIYNNYKIILYYYDNIEFKGFLTIRDINLNRIIFISDIFYSKYLNHNFIDLDNDLKDELIINVTISPSMYNYEALVIIDLKNLVENIFIVTNAKLLNNKSDSSIMVNYRPSPGVASIPVVYFLKYEKKLDIYYPSKGEAEILVHLYYKNMNEAISSLSKKSELYAPYFKNLVVCMVLQAMLLNLDIEYLIKYKKIYECITTSIKEDANKYFNEIKNQNYNLMSN